jgi:hypothetical protein
MERKGSAPTSSAVLCCAMPCRAEVIHDRNWEQLTLQIPKSGEPTLPGCWSPLRLSAASGCTCSPPVAHCSCAMSTPAMLDSVRCCSLCTRVPLSECRLHWMLQTSTTLCTTSPATGPARSKHNATCRTVMAVLHRTGATVDDEQERTYGELIHKLHHHLERQLLGRTFVDIGIAATSAGATGPIRWLSGNKVEAELTAESLRPASEPELPWDTHQSARGTAQTATASVSSTSWPVTHIIISGWYADGADGGAQDTPLPCQQH